MKMKKSGQARQYCLGQKVPKDAVTVEQAAEMKGAVVSTIRRWILDGKLTRYKGQCDGLDCDFVSAAKVRAVPFKKRTTQAPKTSLWERMRTKIRRGKEDSDCWKWLAAKSPNGYGRVSYLGKMKVATHAVWFLTRNEWPKQINHMCDNPGCCNPQHLYAGDQKQNMRDAKQRRIAEERKMFKSLLTE